MKNIIPLISALCFAVNFLSGQGNGDGIQPTYVDIPSSPTVSALLKNKDVNVNLYTGRPNFEIPIYGIGKEHLNSSVSLIYSSGGIQVPEISSWVGLGWSLNVGGVISRTVQGLPDDKGGYLSLPEIPQNPESNKPFLLDCVEGHYDSQPDLFSYNLGNGISGAFFIKKDLTIVLIPKNDVRIFPSFELDGTISGFEIFDPLGNSYIFSTPEESIVTTGNGTDTNTESYFSSWHLSMIRDPNEIEIITFSYANETFNNNITKTEVILYESPGWNTSDCGSTPVSSLSTSLTIILGKRLEAITNSLTGESIYFQASIEDRFDLPGSKYLDKIIISSGGQTVKTFDFFYDSFNGERLKLEKIQEFGTGGLAEPPYDFFYNSEPLPKIDSKSFDHWGYYNGKTGQPTYPVVAPNLTIGSYSLNGNDREPDQTISGRYLGAGMLEKIVFPTGGYTEIEYEPNDYGFDISNLPIANLLVQRTATVETPPLDEASTLFSSNRMGWATLEYSIVYSSNAPPPDPANGYGKITLETPSAVVLEIPCYHIGDYSMEINLEANITYELKVESFEPYTEVEAKITYYDEVPESMQNSSNFSTRAGGVRVKTLKYSDGNKVKQKDYVYKMSGEPLRSSGQLTTIPKYYDVYKTIKVISGTGQSSPIEVPCWYYRIKANQTVFNSSHSGGGPITYKEVKEIEIGNGYVVSEFTNFSNNRPNAFPFHPRRPTSFKDGLIKKQTFYNVSGSMVKEVENDYQIINYDENIKILTTGLVERSIIGLNEQSLNKYHTINDDWYSESYKIESSTTMTYGTTGGDPVAIRTEYIYPNHFQHTSPINVTQTNLSDQTTQTTNIKYPHDDPGAPMAQEMIDRHMIGIPLETLESGLINQGTKTVFGSFNGTQILPAEYYSYKSGWQKEARIASYDNQGFPTLLYRGPTDECFGAETYNWTNGLLNTKTFDDWIWNWTWYPYRQLQSYTDQNAQTTTYEYDGLLRLHKVKQRGTNIETEYNYGFLRQGNPYNYIQTDAKYSDASHQHSRQNFDGWGRLVNLVKQGYGPGGEDVVWDEIEYDNQGRVEKKLYLPGSYTTFEYEKSPLNRVLKEIHPNGFFVKTEYSSNSGGEVDGAAANALFKTKVFDENNNPTSTFTNFLGQHVQTTDAINGKTKFDYHGSGQIAHITTPAGNAYDYAYGAKDLLSSKTVPGGGTVSYLEYSCRDEVTRMMDANGNTIDYEYDKHSREKLAKWDDNVVKETHYVPNRTWVDYYYARLLSPERDGQMLMTDYTYDNYGRIETMRQQNPIGGSDLYNYTYDHADNLRLTQRNHYGYSNKVMRYDYGFDHSFRPTSTDIMIDGIAIPVNGFSYNIRDEVESKNVALLTGGSMFYRKIDYKYNIMGWLTNINKVTPDKFQPRCAFDPTHGFVGRTGRTPYEESVEDLSELLSLISSRGGEIELVDQNPCQDTVILPCYGVDTTLFVNAYDVNSRFLIDQYLQLGLEPASVITDNPGHEKSYKKDDHVWSVMTFNTDMYEADWAVDIEVPENTQILGYEAKVRLFESPPNSIVYVGLWDGKKLLKIHGQDLLELSGNGDFSIIPDTIPSPEQVEKMQVAMLIPCQSPVNIDRVGAGISYVCVEPDPCSLHNPVCLPFERDLQEHAVDSIKLVMGANNLAEELPSALFKVRLCDQSVLYVLPDELKAIKGPFSVLQTIPLENPDQSVRIGIAPDQILDITTAELMDMRTQGAEFSVNSAECPVKEEIDTCIYKIDQENWQYEVVGDSNTTAVRITYDWFVTRDCGHLIEEIKRESKSIVSNNFRNVRYGTNEQSFLQNKVTYIDHLTVSVKNPDTTLTIVLDPNRVNAEYPSLNINSDHLYYSSNTAGFENFRTAIRAVINGAIQLWQVSEQVNSPNYSLDVRTIGPSVLPWISFGVTHAPDPNRPYISINPNPAENEMEVVWSPGFSQLLHADIGSFGILTSVNYTIPTCNTIIRHSYYHNPEVLGNYAWDSIPLPPTYPPVDTTEGLDPSIDTCYNHRYIISYCDVPQYDCYDGDCNPCGNMGPHPLCTLFDADQQTQSFGDIKGQRSSLTSGKLTYPSYLYQLLLCDNQPEYLFQHELDKLDSDYRLTDAVQLTSPGQQLKIKSENGINDTLLLDDVILIMADPDDKLITASDPNIPPKYCDDTPPDCTPTELKAQQQSFDAILDSMSQINVEDISFPATLYQVILCDGSVAYILGDLINQLDGDHTVSNSIIIGGPNQNFKRIINTSKRPLDADFSELLIYNPGYNNGNISSVKWKTGITNQRTYNYSYDPINRLTSALYEETVVEDTPPGGVANPPIPNQGKRLLKMFEGRYDVEGIAYDPDGNIQNITRNGMLEDAQEIDPHYQIDALSYSYSENHLTNVGDNAPGPGQPEGFKATSTEYGYDANGNLTDDSGKGMSGGIYSYLNLPMLYNIGGAEMRIQFDATGRKWSKIGQIPRTYIDGLEYEGTTLHAFVYDEGRVVFNAPEGVRFELALKDHLGNSRMVLADINGNGAIETLDDRRTPEVNEREVIEELHYYPFGLTFNLPCPEPQQTPPNFYRYNYKELFADNGLDLYHYGARMYDPAIGRFTGVDPIADKFAHLSVFNYASNDPIRNIDLHGLQGYDFNDAHFNKEIGRSKQSSEQRLEEQTEAGYQQVGILVAIELEVLASLTPGPADDVAAVGIGVRIAKAGDKANDVKQVVTKVDDVVTTSAEGAGKRMKNRLPDNGEPNSMRTNKSGTTTKKYGPDGKVQKEYNKGHGKNAPKQEQTDHVHDYKPNPNNPTGKGDRMPGRTPKPNEKLKDEYKTRKNGT